MKKRKLTEEYNKNRGNKIKLNEDRKYTLRRVIEVDFSQTREHTDPELKRRGEEYFDKVLRGMRVIIGRKEINDETK